MVRMTNRMTEHEIRMPNLSCFVIRRSGPKTKSGQCAIAARRKKAGAGVATGNLSL